MLPEIRKIKKLPLFTPTVWQTFLMRNYGMLPNSKLAEILGCDEKTVELEAKRLGVSHVEYSPKWKERGYITIIRQNWHILPYSQLLQLMDYTEDYLDMILREDDFLGSKLGKFKPECDEVVYTPLTEEQIAKTDEIRNLIKTHFDGKYDAPFTFYKGADGLQNKGAEDNQVEKIIFPYSLPLGDTFAETDIVEDEYLDKLSKLGCTGIWIPMVLSKMSYYPYAPSYSEGYEERRKNLALCIKQCKKYGIGVYLYANEPRGILDTVLKEEDKDSVGWLAGKTWTACTSSEKMQKYFYEAWYSLFKAVPDIAGIININMSENLTNCFSTRSSGNACPRCAKVGKSGVLANILNTMEKAARDAKSDVKIISNLWGLMPYMNWTEEETLDYIDRLDAGVDVMCVSEFGNTYIDGKLVYVGEYSISKVGPCEETKAHLPYASERGHNTWAKIQLNNTWEFSCIPYLPTFELVMEHVRRLKKLGIRGLMMSWTLGGYPSPMMQLAKEILEGECDYDAWIKSTYGKSADAVKEAVHIFSEAFKNYPMGDILYNGPQSMGPLNFWYSEPTGLASTMVTFPYDAIDMWKSSDQTDEEFCGAIQSVVSGFGKGIELLEGTALTKNAEELLNMARVMYINLYSLLLQFEYFRNRENISSQRALELIEKDEALLLSLYEICKNDARVGYEASNHYFFARNTFFEKLLNFEELKKKYSK